MSAQLSIGAQRAFKVHQRAGSGELQVGSLPGFLEQIELGEFVLSSR
jgi:hypothetical protein